MKISMMQWCDSTSEKCLNNIVTWSSGLVGVFWQWLTGLSWKTGS